MLLRDWLAITIGEAIFAWRPLRDDELEHELEHVRQWRRHGALFPMRYFGASVGAKRAGKLWYHDNRFEVEAREAAREGGAALGSVALETGAAAGPTTAAWRVPAGRMKPSPARSSQGTPPSPTMKVIEPVAQIRSLVVACSCAAYVSPGPFDQAHGSTPAARSRSRAAASPASPGRSSGNGISGAGSWAPLTPR